MSYLALFLSLPTRGGTERMRLWRNLKSLGCGVLRDGVYLLPETEQNGSALAVAAHEAITSGGSGAVFQLSALDNEHEKILRALFDRSEAYNELLAEISAIDRDLPDLPTLRRKLRALKRRQEEWVAIDFFNSVGRQALENQLNTLSATIEAQTADAEPTVVEGQIEILSRADYYSRTWATRRNLWVDRLASAWLIRRFIDPQARFLWLEHIDDCPADALGFDFDGARFTHVGRRVSFETLLASFKLGDDPALARLANVVHTLDVGGTAPEAAGLEAMLKGLKVRVHDDNVLLTEAGQLLDDLYAAFFEKEKI